MSEPLRILETCLYADDLEAAIAFYGGILGLELDSRVPGRHVFFRCGRQMLLVFDPAGSSRDGGRVPVHGASGPGHVAFAVPREALPSWRERLAAGGVAIETEVEWPRGGRSLYVRDPAGNSVEIVGGPIWDLPD